MWPNKRLKIAAAAVLETEMEDFVHSKNILPVLNNILFDGGSSLEFFFTLEDDQHTRTPGFHEEWLDKYLDYDFYKHFRMTRETFYNFIMPKIAPSYEVPPYRGGSYEPILFDKVLLMFTWHFAKGETLETVSDKFDVCVKTVFYASEKIRKIFVNIRNNIIKWPTEREAACMSREFYEISNFPGVIGAIDGCHFLCTIPRKQHDSYQDRKLHHSITLQGICKPNLQFINISTGYPGSLHDARILRESNLFREVENSEENFFYNKYHLLGDSAYPCLTWLLTPYRDITNRVQKNYNYALSQSRVRIEHSFGMLKNRWAILKFINVYSVTKATEIIVACCVLHNLCLENNDYYDEENSDNNDDDDEPRYPDDITGQQKRDRIALSMFF